MLTAAERPRSTASRIKGRPAIVRSLRALLIRTHRFRNYRARSASDVLWAAALIDALTLTLNHTATAEGDRHEHHAHQGTERHVNHNADANTQHRPEQRGRAAEREDADCEDKMKKSLARSQTRAGAGAMRGGYGLQSLGNVSPETAWQENNFPGKKCEI